KGQPPELRAQHALPLMREPQFVRLLVAVEVVHAGRRAADAQRHVLVAEQHPPRRNRVAACGHIRRGEGAVTDRPELHVLRRGRPQELGADDGGRQVVVVQNRLDAGEALQPHDFLAVQRAIRLAEPGVPLVRHLSKAVIKGHWQTSSFVARGTEPLAVGAAWRRYRLPRRACSSSIASKSALKLPLPKPWLPRRWITSMKTVGRSCKGREKICSR